MFPDDLQKRLEAIEERNRRVEAEKAWETSMFRVCLIALLTYLVAAIFLFSANLPHPFLNALVPTIGYILSTQSLPVVKKAWIRRSGMWLKK